MALPTTGTLPLADETADVELVASAARTASGVSDLIFGADNFSGANFHLDVTTASGTTPTLNVYVQGRMSDDSTFTDLFAFSQLAAAGDRIASWVNGGNQEFPATDATLAAGTFRSMLFPRVLRIKWTIGGTNPSFTFRLTAKFYR